MIAKLSANRKNGPNHVIPLLGLLIAENNLLFFLLSYLHEIKPDTQGRAKDLKRLGRVPWDQSKIIRKEKGKTIAKTNKKIKQIKYKLKQKKRHTKLYFKQIFIRL